MGGFVTVPSKAGCADVKYPFGDDELTYQKDFEGSLGDFFFFLGGGGVHLHMSLLEALCGFWMVLFFLRFETLLSLDAFKFPKRFCLNVSFSSPSKLLELRTLSVVIYLSFRFIAILSK